MTQTDLTPKKIIIDVRSEEEFLSGSAIGAINIPLNEIERRADEIAEMKGDIILCCASGNRSGMAQQFLAQKNIKTYNGGSWISANNFQIA
ncbi:MAG: phage shock protein E [Roseivirga sp.]|jgi:phage shock protein E